MIKKSSSMKRWEEPALCSSEISTDSEELEQLCGKQVTATDTELERVRWDFVLARLKYEHEDNEKQRLHEERMEQIHQQAVKRSFSQGLQDVLQPLNQYALFLYCFIVIHVIYTVKDLAIYFFQTHYLFCFAVVLSYVLKKIFQYCKRKQPKEYLIIRLDMQKTVQVRVK
ncbi:transmembrane protein 247 [Strix aluco]|uniref:transmembrane protein 247 n=1 Tax=Strix aluco TaxID=111821 RepID=UPI003DA4EE12